MKEYLFVIDYTEDGVEKFAQLYTEFPDGLSEEEMIKRAKEVLKEADVDNVITDITRFQYMGQFNYEDSLL